MLVCRSRNFSTTFEALDLSARVRELLVHLERALHGSGGLRELEQLLFEAPLVPEPSLHVEHLVGDVLRGDVFRDGASGGPRSSVSTAVSF